MGEWECMAASISDAAYRAEYPRRTERFMVTMLDDDPRKFAYRVVDVMLAKGDVSAHAS